MLGWPTTGKKVNSDGETKVVLEGIVDTNNSTNIPLGAGVAFVGPPSIILDYGIIYVNVKSNVASAIDGLSVQQSTNGAVAQSFFRLHTVFKKTNGKTSTHRISDSIVDDDDAELQKSILTAKTPKGQFININANRIGKDLLGQRDELWLFVTALGNESYYGTINFRTLI